MQRPGIRRLLRNWAKRHLTGKQIVRVIACLGTVIAPARGGVRTIRSDADSIPSPSNMIVALAESAASRELLTDTNSLIGKQASPLRVKTWLRRSGERLTWPTGKLTILYFWSVRCGACRASLPQVENMAQHIQAKGGCFISIHAASTKEELPLIHRTLEENDVSFNVALDQCSTEGTYWESKTFGDYRAAVLPAYRVIGADGRVLSHKSPGFFDWERALQGGDTGNQLDPIEDPRPLIMFPSSWMVHSADPGASIEKRLLLYRPDTPDLAIRRLESSDPNIIVTYTRHSERAQTVFAIQAKTLAPAWGSTRTGTIRATVAYDGHVEVLEIPYQITSMPLLVYPATVYFGVIGKNTEVVKNISLQPNVPRQAVGLRIFDTPDWMTLQLPPSPDLAGAAIPLVLRCQSAQDGVRKGLARLEAVYERGLATQLVQIQCVAIVHDRPAVSSQ